jgi:hypothetical protein
MTDIDEYAEELSKLPQEEWPIWLIIFLDNDPYAKYLKITVERQINEVKKKLRSRTYWEEQIEFINKEVKTLRENLEKPTNVSVLEFLNKPVTKLREEAELFENTKEYYQGINFSSVINDPFIIKFIEAAIEGKETEITQEELLQYIDSQKETAPELKDIASYLQHPNPEKGYGMFLVDTKMNEFLLQGLTYIQREVIESYNNFQKNKLGEKTSNTTKSNAVFNEPRQIITLYFILKQLGLEEQYTSKTQIAKLLHLLAAKEIPKDAAGNDKLDNSILYKKVKEGFKKSDKKYISDLEFIKKIIEPLATTGATGITELITTITNEINNSKK